MTSQATIKAVIENRGFLPITMDKWWRNYENSLSGNNEPIRNI